MGDPPTESTPASPNLVRTLPRANDRLRNRFLLLREIGSGIVLSAWDETTRGEIALKVLRSSSLSALRTGFKRFFRSTISRSQGLRTTARALDTGAQLILCGRTPVGAVDRAIERNIQQLVLEDSDYATAFARLLGAALEHQRGRPSEAIRLLEESAAKFEQGGLDLVQTSVRARLGQLRGGAEGNRRLDAALTDLANLGVARPHSFLNVHAPGFFVGERSHAEGKHG